MLVPSGQAQASWQVSMEPYSGSSPYSDELLRQARQLQHLLSNQLTVAFGYAELLTINPALPPALLPELQQVCQAAADAARTLDELQQLLRALSATEIAQV
jgi:hypothetical protein